MHDDVGEADVVDGGGPVGAPPGGGPPYPDLPPPPYPLGPYLSHPSPQGPTPGEGLPPIAWVAIVVGLVLPSLLGLIGFVVYFLVLLA